MASLADVNNMPMSEYNLRVLCYYDNIAMCNGVNPDKPPKETNEAQPMKKVGRAEFASMLMERERKKKLKETE